MTDMEEKAADRASEEVRVCLRGCRGALTDEQFTQALGRIQLLVESSALEEALMPFARLYAVNRSFKMSDDRALRDIAPGAWPTIGDCRRAYEALGPRYIILRDKQ